MGEKLNKENCAIFKVTVCFECPVSYADNGATWCSHPAGPKPPVPRMELPINCPLREAPAIIMLKEDADNLETMLDRVGERLFGDSAK